MKALLALVALTILVPACSENVPTDDSFMIGIRHSKFTSIDLRAPVGVPVEFVIHNDDPIDHEFIVGDEAVHERHRRGTEAAHGDVAGEVTVEAKATAATTFVFDRPGRWMFACHLPGHLQYGMKGYLIVEG